MLLVVSQLSLFSSRIKIVNHSEFLVLFQGSRREIQGHKNWEWFVEMFSSYIYIYFFDGQWKYTYYIILCISPTFYFYFLLSLAHISVPIYLLFISSLKCYFYYLILVNKTRRVYINSWTISIRELWIFFSTTRYYILIEYYWKLLCSVSTRNLLKFIV